MLIAIMVVVIIAVDAVKRHFPNICWLNDGDSK